MFSKKQTRLILLLTIIITILISVIGLNWNKKEKEVSEGKAVLNKPTYIKEIKKPAPGAVKEKEEPDRKDTGGLKDEGSSIIFD